jgi:hypothetical protein
MSGVPATIGPTLGKLIPLLASNHDGEVVAVAHAIDRVLKSSGRDWHDLAAAIFPPDADTDWRRDARFCNRHRALLSDRELDFIAALACWNGEPSDKQRRWLRGIVEKIRSAA